jgi:hypothetical protein
LVEAVMSGEILKKIIFFQYVEVLQKNYQTHPLLLAKHHHLQQACHLLNEMEEKEQWCH